MRQAKHDCWIEIDEPKAELVRTLFREVAKGIETPKLSKSVCGHILTGAASKGNGGYYNYYFCNQDHKHFNVRAEDANKRFSSYVSSLKPNQAVLKLYNEILLDIKGECVKANIKQAEKLEKDLQSIEDRIERVNDKYFDGEITKAEKQQNLTRYEAEANRLKAQIEALRLNEDLNIKEKMSYSFNLIGNLGTFFQSAPCEVKIKLLGSIFPEKIEFDGKNYRTKSYNKMLDIIYQETKQLQGHKKKKSPKNTGDFGRVPKAGLEPARL